MNERIREIAKQTAYVWHASGDPQIYKFTPEKLEKFAELIVRECANICNDVGVAVFSEPVQNNLGTAQTCKVAIEKHFGIEE